MITCFPGRHETSSAWANSLRLAEAEPTGELIRALVIDPTKDYQPLGRPPGPKPHKPE